MRHNIMVMSRIIAWFDIRDLLHYTLFERGLNDIGRRLGMVLYVVQTLAN